MYQGPTIIHPWYVRLIYALDSYLLTYMTNPCCLLYAFNHRAPITKYYFHMGVLCQFYGVRSACDVSFVIGHRLATL